MSFQIVDELAPHKNVYQQRRDTLIALVQSAQDFSDGVIVLFAPVETHGQRFVQDSTFYYFSGMPQAIASVMVLDGAVQALYVPKYPEYRSAWVYSYDDITEKKALKNGFTAFEYTGTQSTTLHIHGYADMALYDNVVTLLKDAVKAGKKIYTIYEKQPYEDIRCRQVLDRILGMHPEFVSSLVDISSYVARMRRQKSQDEIELMYKAIEITHTALQAGALMIKPGRNEAEVQAAIEYVFTENYAAPAYETIVGSGAQGTILHYNLNFQEMNEDELVVVDAGARYDYYCADITRTFPVSGTFSAEQKELYTLVLQVQQEIAALAKPGMWLFNKDEQEASLHHIAVKLFKQAGGYDEWFVHGIGHFIGLDVHDVGNRQEPLVPGDVITIEPGIYMPDLELGIRIEDNYWIVADEQAICLSQDIPKSCDDIEKMVAESFDVDLE